MFNSRNYHQAYDAERYAQKMKRLKDHLGGRCASCGSTEELEFDHVDRLTKKFSIARKWKLPLSELRPELDKCQLLCRPCHLAKTAAANEWTNEKIYECCGKIFTSNKAYGGHCRWKHP